MSAQPSRRTAHRSRIGAVGLVLATVLGVVVATAGVSDGREKRDVVAGAPALHVVALGDSVPAGSHCGCTAYPRLYAASLGARLHRSVHLSDDARGGWDSGDVLASLRDADAARARDVAGADVVVVQIGANDTTDQHDAITSGQCQAAPGSGDCVAAELTELRTNLAAIAARIAALRHGAPTVVAYLGYWNVYEDGQVAADQFPAQGVAAARALTRRVDAAIWTQAHASGATYVDLVAPFRHHGRAYLTSLLAADGDHPSAAGHRLIAQVLLRDTIKPVRALAR